MTSEKLRANVKKKNYIYNNNNNINNNIAEFTFWTSQIEHHKTMRK